MSKRNKFKAPKDEGAVEDDSSPEEEVQESGSLEFTVASEVHYHGGVKLLKGDPITVGSQAKADRMKAAGVII